MYKKYHEEYECKKERVRESKYFQTQREKHPEYVSTAIATKLLQVTSQTLRRWNKEGKINSIRTPSDIRMYSLEDIHNILGWDKPSLSKPKIAYCRVSSKKQMDDLTRQENFFRSNFPNHELVSDIASGINWKRKGLQTILERAMSGKLSEVVVAHRDRLCRFAFELIEWILKANSVKLVVLDQEDEKNTEKELADDILSIVHVYSCRSMGRRRYKNKENKDIPKQSTKKGVKRVDGNKQICVQ